MGLWIIGGIYLILAFIFYCFNIAWAGEAHQNMENRERNQHDRTQAAKDYVSLIRSRRFLILWPLMPPFYGLRVLVREHKKQRGIYDRALDMIGDK